jgi:hypothetical protein
LMMNKFHVLDLSNDVNLWKIKKTKINLKINFILYLINGITIKKAFGLRPNVT